MMASEQSGFEEWLRAGFDNGWVGPPVCDTHDGIPTSEEEDYALDVGNEPCLHVLRLYAGPAHRAAVEANHSPSVWRASNRWEV